MKKPTKIRMKVLAEFSRNMDGQIVSGHPKHPDEDGRFVFVTEESAKVLEDEKLAKRYSAKDEALDELEVDEGDREDATIAGTGATTSANAERNRRVSTSGKTGLKRRAPARGKAPKPAEKGGAPTGGNETNATTNHGKSSTVAGQNAEGTNAGANEEPDPDAAPTE